MCITHNDDNHPECQVHKCCVGYNTLTCRSLTKAPETPNYLRWLAQTSTLAYIARKVAEVQPYDDIDTCIFCNAHATSEHKVECAYRQAKEFCE